MSKAIRLYLDADITHGPLLASILRQRQFDAVSAVEVGNDALSDLDQLAYAVEQRRTLLTFNIADFIRLAREYQVKGKSHYGIIVSPQIKGDQFKLLLRLVLNLLHRVDIDSLKDSVRFLQEFKQTD